MTGAPQTESHVSSWRKLLTLPGVLAVAVLTTIVGWGATQAVSALQDSIRDPLSWTVETNPALIGAFAGVPIDLTLPAGAQPPTGPGRGCSSFHPWARQQGGVDAGITRLQIVLEGKTSGQLLISDARAIVVGKQSATAGVNVSCPPAGEADLRALSIDLDSPNTRAQYESSTNRKFGFTLGQGEIETFIVTATAKDAEYFWFLEITIVDGGESQTIRVSDDGEPFKTSTPRAEGAFEWNYEDEWAYINGATVVTVPAGEPLVVPR
jgi:hypothetical protein